MGTAYTGPKQSIVIMFFSAAVWPQFSM